VALVPDQHSLFHPVPAPIPDAAPIKLVKHLNTRRLTSVLVAVMSRQRFVSQGRNSAQIAGATLSQLLNQQKDVHLYPT
jgi:hypothetical protein